MRNWLKKLEDPITFFTGILTVVAIIQSVVAVFQYRTMVKTDDAAHNTLTLQFPPLLRATNFIIWDGSESDAPAMTPGESISGVTWVINYGREDATIVKSYSNIYWLREPLPMYRPYIDAKPSVEEQLVMEDGFEPATKMAPGKTARWNLKTVVPKVRDAGLSLYILGFVQYLDRLGTHRAIYFARRYDEAHRRFVMATDNPDYESVE